MFSEIFRKLFFFSNTIFNGSYFFSVKLSLQLQALSSIIFFFISIRIIARIQCLPRLTNYEYFYFIYLNRTFAIWVFVCFLGIRTAVIFASNAHFLKIGSAGVVSNLHFLKYQKNSLHFRFEYLKNFFGGIGCSKEIICTFILY